METTKARPRRLREGFFDKYLQGVGIDIGCGKDPITPDCARWDYSLGNGDATVMEGVEADKFDWVYSSHLLEHLNDPDAALRRWYSVLKPGGYLILYVPHRDLYEARKNLPSKWNPDHKFFLLPDNNEPPHTWGLRYLLSRPFLDSEIVYVRECNEGWDPVPIDQHPHGEYSIEAVIRKV